MVLNIEWMRFFFIPVVIAAKTYSAFDGLGESERITLGHQRRLINSKLLPDVSSVVSWSHLIQCICIYYSSLLIKVHIFNFFLYIRTGSLSLFQILILWSLAPCSVKEVRSWWMIRKGKKKFGFVDSHNISNALLHIGLFKTVSQGKPRTQSPFYSHA